LPSNSVGKAVPRGRADRDYDLLASAELNLALWMCTARIPPRFRDPSLRPRLTFPINVQAPPMVESHVPRRAADSDVAPNFRMLFRALALAACCVGCVILSGCNTVHRRMTIRSDPPGALVMLDGDEVGYTPYTGDFTYYGTREITLMLPGYETLTTLQKVPAPWYQYPGIEFVADNLSPVKVTNRHEFYYQLRPQMVVPTDELLDRANAHRSEAQIGR